MGQGLGFFFCGQKILWGIICQHTLDPGGSCCALALLTKSDISLRKNTHLRPPSSFNILTRVGARASHGSKIKD